MKSNRALVIAALLFLIMAVSSSLTLWGSITAPVKIAMFVFGFTAGSMVGTLIARRAI